MDIHNLNVLFLVYKHIRECIQLIVYIDLFVFSSEKCGCGNPFRWNARSVVLHGTDKPIHIPLCQVNNTCYIAAASELMNTDSIWRNYCSDCTEECSVSDFTIKSSSLLAPPEFYMNDIKQFVELSNVQLPVNWSTTWMSDIKSSYVSLEIACETTRTEIQSQQPTITPVDVVSNVGGQTGLWIGISFLSLLEVVEMLYRLLHYQCYSLRQTIQRRFGAHTSNTHL